MNNVIKSTILTVFLLTMIVTTVVVSLQSNLFVVFPDLIKIPWFNATLIDFYLNQFMIWGIVLHLEKYKFIKTLPWLVFMICFGSMATAIYFLIYINKKGTKND